MLEKYFISATKEYTTFENHVPAPYIRKSFVSDVETKAEIKIAACGFYEFYFNGKKLTKGFLAPYISNTEDYIYYDKYEISVEKGENVIGLILGNGFQNNPGGYIWYFDQASFRSAPMVSLILTYKNEKGEEVKVVSDNTFKTYPSPIRFDDYRFGEVYDANFEIDGWNLKDFDDSLWKNALDVTPPCGELKLCEATPIVLQEELKPVEIFECENGFIYDFGICNAGVCRLKIKGQKGQKIEFTHADALTGNDLNIEDVWFKDVAHGNWERDKNIVHKDTYICKSDEEEMYVPSFTYHGFRYVRVVGISKEQATSDLLTYLVIHSEISSRGGFNCSDETLNTLQLLTRRSDVSNFHYFPTDCPQREKNGWTADVALSCEQFLLNYNPEKNYREWLFNLCRAQNEDGALPGIVPTTGWGFEWGNGPAWDCVLAYVPYFVYRYCGEKEMIYDAKDNFIKYLKYLKSRIDENGLVHIGLGDWCQVLTRRPKAPLEVTDTIMSLDIAEKMAYMFDVVGMKEEKEFALKMAEDFKKAFRNHLIDFKTMTVKGECQTSQAMAIYYGLFEKTELDRAFEVLLSLIHKADDHMDVGVLGGKVIFHILAEFGYADLAYKMITRPDCPSYGNWLERGATTLWEDFMENEVASRNHHFWGDISAWFIKCIAGLNYNPFCGDFNYVCFKPNFLSNLTFAESCYESPKGKISCKWEKVEDKILYTVVVPEGMSAKIKLPKGCKFADGLTEKDVKTGKYEII